MNKREAKLRGLKIIHHHLYKMNIEGTLENSVDDDTFDCEMEQIGDEMRFFIYQLEQRISRLESRRTSRAADLAKRSRKEGMHDGLGSRKPLGGFLCCG